MIFTGFGVAQQEFEIALVVLRGLFDGQPVVRGVSHTQPEAVGLDQPVARAFHTWALGVDAGQQAAGGVAGRDIRRDAQPSGSWCS
jgi:hypothetical protein